MKKHIYGLIMSLSLFGILQTTPEYCVTKESIQNTAPAMYALEWTDSSCPDADNPSDDDGQETDSEIGIYSCPKTDESQSYN